MILAVPAGRFDSLEAAGELDAIQDEMRRLDKDALRGRIERGELVHVKHAQRHDRGTRDRCYNCGDEVTPCHRRHDQARYFRHISDPDCIGDPANPVCVKHRPQRA